MNANLNRWLNLDQYTDQVERNRALYLGIILPTLSATMIVLLVFDLLLAGFDIQPVPLSAFLGVAGVFLVCVIAWNQLRRGHLGRAVNIVVCGAFAALVVELWPFGLNSVLSALLPVSVMLVAVVAGWRLTLLYTLAVVLFTVVNVLAENAGVFVPQWNTTQSLHLSLVVLPVLSLLVMVSVAALMSNLRMMTRRAQTRLEAADFIRRVNERLAPALDIDWLFERAIDMVLEQYPQIEVLRLYTADTDTISLAVSTEGAETEGIATGSRIPIGGPHAVGHVAGMLEVLLAHDSGREEALFDIDWVYGARSLAMMPMMVGDTLFGVFEVQSLRPDAFDEETVSTLAVVANLIAVYGERTRHLQEVQWQADAMYLQLQDLQQELARAHGEQLQQVAQSWEKYLGDMSLNEDLVFDMEKQTLTRDTAWSPTLETVFEEKRVVHTDDQEKSVIGIPIWASGQIIGALEFELGAPPTVDQIQMVRQVGERLGLAADNTRLFAEAQRTVSREAMVNRIGERLQGASDMRAALETAAQALSEALGVPRVSVRIGQPEQEADDT